MVSFEKIHGRVLKLSNGGSLGTGSVIDVWFSFTGIVFCEGCDLPTRCRWRKA